MKVITSISNRPGRMLAVVGLLSYLLRAVMVLSGGQYYWPDEGRYDDARVVAHDLVAGDVTSALQLLGRGDHPLFKLVAIPATVAQHVAANDPRPAALVLAGFSAVNIALLGAIALRLGATSGEATFASLLLAASSTFFYFARHLVPYDVAMTFDLLAVYVAVGEPVTLWSSVCCGLLAGCAFLTYAGSWTFGAAAAAVHLLRGKDLRDSIRRGAITTVGIAIPIAVLTGLTMLVGSHLIQNFRQFGSAVNQGVFSEGWRLPWEYLWYAEHGLLVGWLVATVWSVWLCRVRCSKRLVTGLTGLIVIYAILAGLSAGSHLFVVYGRLARQLVPCFCLVTAAALWDWRSRLPAKLQTPVTVGVAALVVIQAGFNFVAPLRMTFPADFLQRAQHIQAAKGSRLLPVNARHLYPGPEAVSLPQQHRLVVAEPHPLQFRPYQYEGYTPTQRALLRSADIRMKLYEVPADPHP